MMWVWLALKINGLQTWQGKCSRYFTFSLFLSQRMEHPGYDARLSHLYAGVFLPAFF